MVVVARVFRRGAFLRIGNQSLASEEASYSVLQPVCNVTIPPVQR